MFSSCHSQSKVWKEWGFLGAWIKATGAEGVRLVELLKENEDQPVTVGTLRPLRKLHTFRARQSVLTAMKQRGAKVGLLKESVLKAQREQWFNWHWQRACENNAIDPDKSMRCCVL